uniref:Uncharacterized protein n=1 Tax=Arundo donax TaxID=35708 RepID=A0A0A9AP83_ARUDO
MDNTFVSGLEILESQISGEFRTK